MLNFCFSCLSLLIIFILSSCTLQPVQDKFSQVRPTLKIIDIRVGDFAPRGISSEKNPGKYTATGAIVGAVPGAVGMAGIAPLCANPYTAGVCAVFMPIFGLMTVAGGGVGAAHGESTGNIKTRAHKALVDAVSGNEVQRALIDKINHYGTATANLNFKLIQTDDTPSSDAILEVAILKIDSVEVQSGFFGIVSTHYAVNIEARARLKRVTDNTILADRTYRYFATPRPPKQWSENDGKQLVAEINQAYSQLAEWIIDDFFLGQFADTQPFYPLPLIPSVSPCKGNVACSKRGNGANPVDTLRPTLHWSFDVTKLKEDFKLAQLAESDVTYDIRVFLAEQLHTQYDMHMSKPLWPMLHIYSRSGISDTFHMLEEDLPQCSNYLWTVRAMINQNGHKRATEWSGNYYKGAPPVYLRQTLYLSADDVLIRGTQFNYAYPFSTPCKGGPAETAIESNGNENASSSALTSESVIDDSSDPALTATTINAAKMPTQEAATAPLVEGTLLGKELKTGGIAGLAKVVELKLLFRNVTEKDIIKINGKIKLFDDAGKEIGVLPFHLQNRIKKYGEIKTSQYIYPVLFSWYPLVKQLDQEKIHAEFTFDLIQFDESIKLKFFD